MFSKPFRAVYAQLDLKNAKLYLIDAYTGIDNDFAINNVAGYMAGATSIAVDTGTGQIPVSDRFTIAGDSSGTVYTVQSTAETTGNTTTINFTPALGGAVADDALITFKPHLLEVKLGEGNLSYSERRNMIYVKDRGLLDEVREGDEEMVDVRIDAIWEFIRASSSLTVPTIEDVLKKRGVASTWVSTDPDTCRPYCIDIVILHEPPCSSVEDEKTVLEHFRWEGIDHDLRQATFSITGKCNKKEASSSRAASFVL